MTNSLRTAVTLSIALLTVFSCSGTIGGGGVPTRSDSLSLHPFLDTLQSRTLLFFLDATDPATGLTPDRFPSASPASIGAMGFALTAYPVAVERRMMVREEAARRVLRTLRFLFALPQGSGAKGASGYRGFFYHFLDRKSGLRTWNCELSTMDTALLMAGVLFCQSYFDLGTDGENEIREVADSLFRRVDWRWAMGEADGIHLGWEPESGFHRSTWQGYNEAMILYLLALGSPTFAVPGSVWSHWTSTYVWAEFEGEGFVSFGPLFGHQFSHCWIDFRGIQDPYMMSRGTDYFENSRKATYTQRSYAVANPRRYRDYADTIWGFSACDGPRDTSFISGGIPRVFQSYAARGVSADWVNDDGTLSPAAAGGSLPFAPEIALPCLRAMRNRYGEHVWRKYGFVDSFNPTYVTPATGPGGWFDGDYLGIDQGPVALMIENLRNSFVWNVMKKNKYVLSGLQRAGFTGGWLEGR
jgi:hypothetical protein